MPTFQAIPIPPAMAKLFVPNQLAGVDIFLIELVSRRTPQSPPIPTATVFVVYPRNSRIASGRVNMGAVARTWFATLPVPNVSGQWIADLFLFSNKLHPAHKNAHEVSGVSVGDYSTNSNLVWIWLDEPVISQRFQSPTPSPGGLDLTVHANYQKHCFPYP